MAKIKKFKSNNEVVFPATIIDAIKDVKSIKVANVETNVNYGKTLRQILDSLTGDITILNGDTTVEGSVSKKVSDAIAEIIANAPEDFDTLKEIADWIANDENKTAADIVTTIGHPAKDAVLYVEGDEIPEGKQVGDVKEPAVEATGIYKVIQDAQVELTIKEGSEDYIGTDGAEIEIKTVALGDAVGMSKNAEGKWVAATGSTAVNGLAIAADVASELVADEQIIAAALNNHEDRLLNVEGGCVTTEDSTDTADYQDLF